MENSFEKFIELHDNFLTAEECQDIIAQFKSGLEKERFHFPCETSDFKGDTDKVFGPSGLTVSKMIQKTNAYAGNYLKKNNIDLEVNPSAICLLQHREGTPMKKHYDEEMDYFNNEEKFRLCAALIYLNDDYQDGEIVFEDIGYTYKPKAGTLILFPTSFIFTHKVNPAIGNDKYLIKFSYEVDKDKYLEITQTQAVS